MGLGKTAQAAVALAELLDSGSIRRALITCPSSLIFNWEKELWDWAQLPAPLYRGSDRHGMLEGGARVLISTYETLARDLDAPTRGGEVFADLGIDVFILDEAQFIKDPDSALTGTPLENRLEDLASILRWLYPNEFCDRGSFSDHQKILKLRDRSLLRRTKDSVGIELPSKTITHIPVALSPSQAAEYDLEAVRLKHMYRGATDPRSGALLVGLQNMRRVCSIASDGSSAKIDLIADEIESSTAYGRKIVVFSSMPRLIFPELEARIGRGRCTRFIGSMSPEDRLRSHSRFVKDETCSVMCASLKVANVGMTWTVATTVYHLDSWWNPQVMRQADDRVYRIGQTRPVWIKRLYSPLTIEEEIMRLAETKMGVFNLVVDHGGTPIADMDTHAIRRLIELKSLPFDE